MARRTSELSKRSLVVNDRLLREWVRLGGYRNGSEAVRAAIARVLAIRKMQDAVALLQSRGKFGRKLR